MKAKEIKEVVDTIDISALVSTASRAAEKKCKLNPIFLSRDSFAANASTIGSLELDRIVGGGIPPSRVIGISGPEHSGKSLIATELASEQLKAGRIVCYMDAEGGNDPLFLKSRGIDFEKYRGKRNKKGDLNPGERDFIYYYQPTNGEQLVHYMNDVMTALPENRNPAHPPIIFLLDSVVALISSDVTEDIDANRMAMHAKMYSEILPIIVAQLNRTGCSFIYTNQLRNKPMVAFGCLQGDLSIQFVDGKVHLLKDVVSNKIQGSIWSYENGKIVPRKITNWFDNGKSSKKDWLRITTEGPGSGNGFYSIVVTNSHKVLTANNKWVEARSVKIGDFLVSKKISNIKQGSVAEQFVLGTLIGDSCVPKGQINKDIILLKNSEQPEYLNWKLKKLSSILEFYERKNSLFISKPCLDLGSLANQCPNRSPLNVLSRLSNLSLAVWYMDDGSSDFKNSHCRGSISIKRFKKFPQDSQKICEWFKSTGMECQVKENGASIIFNKEGFIELSRRICQYIPESMQYKLPPEFRGQYKDFDLETYQEVVPLPVKVTKVIQGLGNRSNRKYDLEIEGSHNYIAGHERGGLVVHNSSEYEPCGSSLQFYSSIRFRLGGSKPKFNEDKDHPFIDGFIPGATPKQGGVWQEPVFSSQGEEIGMDKYVYTAVRTVKNKVYSPQKVCWIRIQFESNGATGHGLDPVYDVFTFLLNTQQLEKTKAWKNGSGQWVLDGSEEKKPKGHGPSDWVYKLLDTEYNLKEFKIPEIFNYADFKKFIKNSPGLGSAIRQKMMVEGSVLLGAPAIGEGEIS